MRKKNIFIQFFLSSIFEEVIWFLFVNTAKTENMQELQFSITAV